MYTIDICVKIMNYKNFPNVSSKDVYNTLIGKITPDIETRYPLYNWKQIWLNIYNKTVDISDVVVLRTIRENLPPFKFHPKT